MLLSVPFAERRTTENVIKALVTALIQSGIKRINPLMQKAKEQGYVIHLRYVGVATPEIAKARVEQRIARGGHGVSGGTIDRRFKTSKENFLQVYPYCDSIIIYDNTEQMTCVASIKNDKLDLMQEVLWVNELLSGLDLE